MGRGLRCRRHVVPCRSSAASAARTHTPPLLPSCLLPHVPNTLGVRTQPLGQRVGTSQPPLVAPAPLPQPPP